MALQSLDITARSATTTPSPGVRETQKVAKLIDVSKCIGCKACQVACMEWNHRRDEIGTNHGVYDNPLDLTDKSWTVMRFSEVEVEQGKLEWLIRKDGCMHCEDPGCLRACPAPGAIVQYSNGIVDFVQENCIGCQFCVTGCPFDVPKISPSTGKVYKCTLCSDRVGAGLEPACAKACPTNAISFGTREKMLAQATSRAEQLKADGNAAATVYNPEGVGGTHVVYVLPHGDEPDLYGLPKNPRVTFVRLWKGPMKWLGNLVFAGGIVGVLLHYLGYGPRDVEEPRQDVH